MECRQKLTNGASDEIHRKVLEDVLVLEDKISQVENVLLEAGEEMKKLTVERRNGEAEELRVADTSKAVFGREDPVRRPRL